MTLSKIRKQINDVDEQLIELLAIRAKLAKKVFEQKLQAGNEHPFSPQREKELFERVSILSTKKMGISANGIFCEIVSLCRNLEKATKIIVLESEIPNVEIAATKRFGSYIKLLSANNVDYFLKQMKHDNYLGFIQSKSNDYKKIIETPRIEIIYEYCFKPIFSGHKGTYSLVKFT